MSDEACLHDGMKRGGEPGTPERHVPDASTIVSSVRTLVDIMGAGNINELDISFGKVSIRLRSGSAVAAPVSVATAPATTLTEVVIDSAPPSHEQHITAPMVGTFYSSPTPGAPPYVKVGDHVEVGQTVGIIEAMKIMNEIAADRAGLVTAVLIENGQAVEYGSPIVRLDPTRGGMVTVVASGS